MYIILIKNIKWLHHETKNQSIIIIIIIIIIMYSIYYTITSKIMNNQNFFP